MKDVVLITGCSSGFGKLTAETLARKGYIVRASMRNSKTNNREAANELESIAKKEKLNLKVVDLDVLDSSSVKKAVDSIVADAGKIDVLINNAGAAFTGITEAFTEEQALKQFDTNFFSILRLNKAVLPSMRKNKKGLIISISSVAGRVVFPFFGLYCATKFALEAMTESLRYELADLGVDSIIVEPSAYPTPIINKSVLPEDKKITSEYGDIAQRQVHIQEAFDKMFASAHPPDPQEIADVILHLIETPFGKRPLRTIVGNDFGANKINSVVNAVQHDALHALGL